MRHDDPHAVAIDRDGCVPRGRAVHAVERNRAHARGAWWQFDLRRRGANRHLPFVAGDVPVELIVLVEESQPVRRVVPQHECPVGVRGAWDPDLVLEVRALAIGLGPQIPPGVVLRALQRDAQCPVQSLRRPVFDGNGAVQSVPGAHESGRDGFGHVDAGVLIDANAGVEPLDGIRPLGAQRRHAARDEEECQRNRRDRTLGWIGEAEELPRPQSHHRGNDSRGELGDGGVEIPHDGVVVAPRVLEMVFDVGQRGLQSCEAGGRFELRVRLGEGDHALQRAGERILLAGACPRPLVTGLQRAAARRDECFQRAALVASVALHDGHHVGNEIVPAFQLHVDIGPGVVAQLPQARQAIERVDDPRDDEQCDHRDEIHGPTLARQRSECEDGLSRNRPAEPARECRAPSACPPRAPRPAQRSRRR